MKQQCMPRGPDVKLTSFLPIVTTIAFDHTEYSDLKKKRKEKTGIGCLKRRSSPKGFSSSSRLRFWLVTAESRCRRKYQFCYPDNRNRCVVSFFLNFISWWHNSWRQGVQFSFGLSVQQHRQLLRSLSDGFVDVHSRCFLSLANSSSYVFCFDLIFLLNWLLLS